jgi:glutamate-1-semialdehyde 2,1-aminomutase
MVAVSERRDAFRETGSRSASLSERAKKVMPGGNTRLTVYQAPYPPYAERGIGSVVIDADGDERYDFINNYTSLLHGHADPDIIAAVTDQLQRGTAFALPTEREIILAELLTDRIASVEQVRFTNSGSEAVMMAIKAARAHTGRSKLVVFEGSYHGSYDGAEAGMPPNGSALEANPQAWAYSFGTPKGVLENVIVLPYNNLPALEETLDEEGARIAAVMIDPMPLRLGMIEADQAYIARLRAMTAALGIVLIFDEVVNLRVTYGGAQALYNVKPDLTTMGKIIGGGFAVGAVGGSAEVMSVFDPTKGSKAPHGGTFNANPITMTAGAVAMQKFDPAAVDRLNALSESFRSGLSAIVADAGIDGQVTGAGSLFTIHLHNRPLTDYRSTVLSRDEQAKATRFYQSMLANGIFMSSTMSGCLSTPMGDTEVQAFLAAFSTAIEETGMA